ncbi:MAG TPA: F0F1 ATP synthase subunit delta [Gammaproteobacteria bacterium]|nr:F0F1 ATP synthase subunit delta [Gammaproteobacteria bacterium]
MTAAKLARPYAKAAFEYAQQHRQLDHWAVMLQTMAELIKQPTVQQLLKNPKYSSEAHSEISLALGQDILDEAGKNFIKLLALNHRLSALPDIVMQFEQLRAAIEQTLTVRVKSAIPLDEDYQQHLVKLLNAKFQRHIILQCEVDKNVLGGLLITAGDHVIDGTVKGQLERMREVMVN